MDKDQLIKQGFKLITIAKWHYINNEGTIYNMKTQTFVKGTLHSNGYMRSGIWLNGKMKGFAIHRAVADVFLPNPNNYPQVNHIDGNKLNNHVSNLEWCTQIDNMKHAHENKLRKDTNGMTNKLRSLDIGDFILMDLKYMYCCASYVSRIKRLHGFRYSCNKVNFDTGMITRTH